MHPPLEGLVHRQPRSHNSFFVDVGGLRLRCLRWGRHGRGRSILLLHGLSSTARSWELVAPHLAHAGYEAIAHDMRGHGLSDKPDEGYDFETTGADVAGLAGALALERPLVVGHSWGATLALSYGARYSRGPISPSGLVLIDGGMGQLDDIPGATWDNVRDALAPPKWAGKPLEDLLARLRDPSRRWHPDERTIEIIKASFEIGDDGTIAPHLTYDRHIQALRALWDFKTYEYYERLRCPVHMIPAHPPDPLSLEDQLHLALKEKAFERARTGIPDLRVHWMNEAMHDVPLQRPLELADQIINSATET